ncbi:RNA polymerase sigma factor [Cellulomonas sp. URHD0024]|uniref:RNA polymerase sigma factor n=1 Tax=Cellulomonas sp. URHD0024 TaxID=1302620 RepID=UPI0006847EC6|nr:sigma factor-like helix-turn-helix DNA-binding protein [Cellulomonas sp. URHD0024]
MSADPRVEDAFALLYSETHGRIVRYAARRGASDPEDVAEGVFRLAWTAAQQGVPVTLGWLVGAADSLLPAIDLGIERRVLRMRYWDKLSITEIATVTGESRTTVLRHLNAARRVPGEPNPVPEVEVPMRQRAWDELRALVPRAAATLEKSPPRRKRLSTPVRWGLVAVAVGIVVMIAVAPRMAPPRLDSVLDFPYYTSTADLEDASDTIVLGTLTGLSGGVGTIDVTATAKGSPTSTFTYDARPDSPTGALVTGHEYVVLLADGALVNSAQGFYPVQDGTAVPTGTNTIPLSSDTLAALDLH